MKRTTLSIALLAMLSFTSSIVNAVPTVLSLQVGITDPTIIFGGRPKAPASIPHIEIEGSTILFTTSCDGYSLSLVDETGEEAYSITIPDGCDTLELPSTLIGDYEIRLSNGGSYYFYGFITL
ncbi:MAG: hypothetical protein IJ841_06980 [Prevotella sp.]|nr:hypothetical protein [Prevotella sp.]